MRNNFLKSSTALLTGALLTLPLPFFLFISVLKFELDQPYLYDISYPFLQTLGLDQSPGFNINGLFVAGPAVALLLKLLAVMSFSFRIGNDEFIVQLTLRKKWWNYLMLVISGMALLFLFLYLALENCNCPL